MQDVVLFTVMLGYLLFAGTEGQVYGSYRLLRGGQRIQPDPGESHWNMVSQKHFKKIIFFFCFISYIKFCVCISFLACNYCRLCRACVSCMGRFPSPKGNHRLGITYTLINTHPYREGDIQIYVVPPSCLVTLSIHFCFLFHFSRSSRSHALRF